MHDDPLPCDFLPLVRAHKSQRHPSLKLTATTNTVGIVGSKAGNSRLYLKGLSGETEQGLGLWNMSVGEMKFSVERSWMKSVRIARNKPNYGMSEIVHSWRKFLETNWNL